MNRRETDTFEELFRSKLYDFEAETSAGDWENIANCLPESRPQRATLRQRWHWTAAASIAALLVIAGTIFLFEQPEMDPVIAEIMNTADEKAKKEFLEETISIQEQPVTEPVIAVAETPSIEKTKEVPFIASTRKETFSPVEIIEESDAAIRKEEDEQPVTIEEPITDLFTKQTLITEVHPEKQKKSTARRWSFGMGGGSLSAGASNVANGLVYKNVTSLINDDLLWQNAFDKTSNAAEYKTKIKHKTPVSLGLGVSYSLNDRWAIQTGLSYAMLTSDWETQAKHNTQTRQRLHFIGIPVSLTYKIAEWNNLRFYASAGFMPEMNVAGKLRVKEVVDKDDGQQISYSTTTESIRVKPVYWSINRPCRCKLSVIQICKCIR